MHKVFVSDSIESEVMAANLEFYRQMAFQYDSYESCTFDHDLQRMLETDLDRMTKDRALLGRPVSCLDCGGGTGNLTLKMLRRGWTVTVVDISPEMLDLIAFSSVLHHLYSYLPVICKAVRHISPGGHFYSSFDPVVPRYPRLKGLAESLDVIAAKLLYNRSDFLPGVSRRIRKLTLREDPVHKRPVASAGDLAEYHAHMGLNDLRILAVLRDNGLEIVEHSRYAMGRTAFVRALSRQFHMLESFKIIARRPLGHRT